MKLVALKKLRYPSGPSAKEYKPGDEFEVLSERDAKALTVIRVAKFPDPKPVATRAMTAEEPKPRPKKIAEVEAEQQRVTPRTYRRTDMKSED